MRSLGLGFRDSFWALDLRFGVLDLEFMVQG